MQGGDLNDLEKAQIRLLEGPSVAESDAARQNPMARALTKPVHALWQAEDLAAVGCNSAGVIAATNAFGAFYFLCTGRQHPSVLATSSMANFVVSICASAAAVGLMLVLWKRRPVWACLAIAAWSVADAIMPFTQWLYNHFTPPGFAAVNLTAAVISLRGAYKMHQLRQR
ncbi:MAG: hypothetical protein WA840_24645 [Caulobacteraceae bacterium]